MKVAVCIMAAAAIALTGCATKVADFEKMGPEKYSLKTCKNSTVIRQMAEEYRSLQEQGARVSGNVSRGYAIHRDCYSDSVPGGSDTDCYTDYYGNVHCSTSSHAKSVTRCRDVPVAINVEAEQRKLEKIADRLNYLDAKGKDIMTRCVKKVRTMSPGVAWGFWKNRELPVPEN